MSVLKLSKNDIIRNEDKEEKIKLKRSDLSFDSARVSGWEQANRQSLDILNDYNNRINKSEWLDDEDRKKYRSALDSYIETSNLLRGINKTFGEGYSEEDEQAWNDSIAYMNKGYDEINGFYDQFASDMEYDSWHKSMQTEEDYKKYFEGVDTTKATQGWQKYLEDEEAKRNVLKYDLNKDGKEAWWEKALGRLGQGNVDTSMPMAGYSQVLQDIENDESYRRPGDEWTEEQRNAFGNLYIESPDLAYAFAEQTNKRNNKAKEEAAIKKIQESAISSFGAGAGHTLGAIVTAPLGLADFLGDHAYANAGRDIAPDGSVSPFEYSQAVTGGISEHLNEKGGTIDESVPIIGGKGWGDVYSLGTSIAQSMASGYLLGPVGTLVSYFGQGAAAGVDDAIARGATDEQALLYGAALGTFEGVAEMIGIDKLFSLGSASTLKGLIKNVLKQASAEGAEEGLTSVLSLIADTIVMQDKSNMALQIKALQEQGASNEEIFKKVYFGALGDIIFDTIAGAVSGSVSGGLHSGVHTAITNAETKKNYSGQAQDIVNDALASENEEVKAVGEKYQKKLDKNKELSGWNLNELLDVSDTHKVKSAIEARLTELGETEDISLLADVLTKQAQGYDLTMGEKNFVRQSSKGYLVATELDADNIKSGNLDNKWAKDIGTRRLNADVYNKSAYDLIADAIDEERKASLELSEIDAVTENATTRESAVESEISAPVEGVKSVAKAKMTDTEGKAVDVKVAKIASVEGDVATLELEGGETVRASDVDFGDSGIGFVYQAATEMVSGVGGFNVDAANLMVKAVNPNISTKAADLYVAGFNEAYRYGAMGYPVSELSKGGITSKIGVKQRELAYNLGRAFGEGKVSEKQANIDNIKEKAGQKASQKGKVYFDGSAVGKSLTERQRASLKGLRVVAEAMGIDIRIFESEIVDGKRVGKNGSYNPSTKTIEIDLYAGVDGNGLILFTASHELTHYIREVAPAKFKVFADALLEEYTKNGVSLDELISRKLETLEANGRLEGKTKEQAYDLAYEEVVADAAESMLVDSNAIEALSRKLQAKDKSLWERIRDFIAKLVNRIKAAYEGLDPDSREGKLVREMADSAERLRQLWVDALLEASDIVEIDTNTESVAPMLSERTWTASEYVTEREETAKKISKALGVSLQTAYKYIDDINGVARLIADDRARLDYEPNLDDKATVLKPNSDYKYSVDMSTLCAKRLLFTGTFDAIQRQLPNTVFDSEDIVSLREMMQKRGYEVACGICYVESTRREIGRITQEFINGYKEAQKTGKPITRINSEGKAVDLKKTKDQMETTADKSTDKFFAEKGYTPTLADLNTTDIDLVKRDHPLVYEAYLNFMNARGQAKPKLLETRAEYKGEILKHFKQKNAVNARNNAGGLRLQSFSDFEVPHLIDMMQIVMDMSRVGLKSQAYTKVPAFAEVFGDSGVKINLSLIAKGDGLDANGNLIFDDVEGINHKEAFKLRDKFSKNVGTILVGKTDAHIIAAMADSRIDYIIPFHKSSWKESLYDALGLTGYADYTETQNEKPLDKDRKIKNFDPSEYWDFTKSGDENAQKYLEMCREDGRIPKFPQFQGYPGYWKLLIDFKMYDNDGVGSPQEVVKPVFNTEASEKVLREYEGGHKSFPVAKDVVRDFVNEHKDKVKYSDRDSLGNELSAKQKEFFKDSKARDEDGNLYVLYHGTSTENRITQFLTTEAWRTGLWLSTDHATAVHFARATEYVENDPSDDTKLFTKENSSDGTGRQGVYELYANVKNPLIVDAQSKRYWEIPRPSVMGDGGPVSGEEINAFALQNGYDGVIIEYVVEGSNRLGTDVIVFSPNQVKYTDNLNPTEGNDIRYSDRASYAPTFYSHMGKVIDDVKLEKMGTSSILNHLKNRGVKDEEIKWSGIEAFLEGKKSVTKAELQKFVAGSQLQIVEQMSDDEEYTRWSQYKLEGGSNYRELVFQMPNSSYSNNAMRAHWGDEGEGILVHARIQDFDVDGKKMLFIEELQSDWHNEGAKDGYAEGKDETRIEKLKAEADEAFFKVEDYSTEMTGLAGEWDTIEKTEKGAKLLREYREAKAAYDNAENEFVKKVPDAPFRDNYHEYVLKRLLRMAAEEGYDSIGWTPSEIQSDRWSDEFAEGYRIEYDQEMPKFLRKYGKKWGAKVGETTINDGKENFNVWSMDITDSMKDSVLYEGQVFYSDRVTDKKTLDFLENQKHVTVYRAMQVIDGELYPPMAAKVKLDNGKKSLVTPSKIGVWEQAVERPDLIRNGNKFELDKANGSSIQAAYNPYFHTSASPLNDQFSSAYKRPNLVIVEGEIPASELTSGYRAEFAKDTVGETKWHSGPVASKLKGDKARRVFLSRWFKPVRIVPDSEVASIVAKTLEGENIDVPYNVVTPTLRAELEKVGVPIKYQDRNPDSYSNRSLLANALETAVQNDIEREKLRQYKQKIDLINAEEQKLHDLREQIKELSFAKGPRDTQAIKSLQFEANQAANRINTYDKQLLNLESTKALKGVLEREKALARKRDAQKYKEALERYREKSAKTQRELMDRYHESRKRATEGRNKTAMRHKIKDVVNELNNYLLKGTKDKHVPIELQKAVAEALDAVNMDTVGAEERIANLKAEMMRAKTPEAMQDIAKKIDHIEEMGGNMAKKLSRLKTAYDSIINSDDPLVANSHDDVISSTIEKVMEYVGETPLRDMSLHQLEAVYDMYRMVLHSVRTANKAFKAKKSEEISVIANRVMEEIDKLGKKKAFSTKTGLAISEFDWNNQKPIYAFERIGSDTFTEVFNNVRAGEDTWAVDMTEAQEFRVEQVKTYRYDSWDFKKRFGFTSASGMHFELSLDQIMSLYAYSKREQAAEHLKRGGIVFDETTEVTVKNKLGIPVKFNPTEATAYNLSDETLADIISKLSPEQKAFVDVMQDYLSTTMGEKGNEVSLELYGVKLFKEKHYFPLRSATQFMAKAKEQQKGEVKIKNSGFSKETVYKANNPIVLTPFMDVWAGHVNEMSMYHAFVLALEDFYRVYNYKTPTSETMATESVEMFLQNAHGKGATKYIDQLLKDLNGGARVDSTVGIINKLTGLFKKSAVFASASVVVQQPSAIARATALVDAKYFVGKPSGHKETWAEVKEYAPVAVIKEMGYFDTGMGKSSVEWLKGEKTWKDTVDDIAAKAPALADEYAWCAIWNAVKRETVHNNPSLKTSSEEFLKLVGERFTEVVTKTQVYDSVLARSANMRSKDTGMKMATAFMGEPTTSLNMLENALIQGKRGNKKVALRAVGGVVSSMILNSILVSIVYAGRDDDEEKTYAEKYISTLTEELLDSFNPLTLVPFIKDIVSIVQGYDIERSDMAVITDLINAWNNLDSDNRSVYRKVEDFGGAIAAIFGLPVKNVMRDVRGMYNTVNSFINGEKTTGSGIASAIEEAVTGKEQSNGQQLYEAMVKGDSAQVERLKGRFEDQKAIDTAIRKALRENDSRIKEAAEAYLAGDFAKYNSLRAEIVAEGIFSNQLVTDALKAEYNYLKKKANED